MLRGIDTLLGPELLSILRAMGHGDEIAIVDANYPAETDGRRLVRVEGASATDVLRAILSVMPLDTFVDAPAACMAVVGAPDRTEPIMADFQTLIDEIAVEDATLARMERFAFYDRARKAYACVSTSERALYACIILKKGVL